MSEGYSLALLSLSLSPLRHFLSVSVSQYRSRCQTHERARELEILDRHRAAGTVCKGRSDVHLVGESLGAQAMSLAGPTNAARAYIEAKQADKTRALVLEQSTLP